MKIKREILFENFEFLISFFYDNYRLENYDMNICASEFFLFLLENYENELREAESKGNASENLTYEKKDKEKEITNLNFCDYLKE